MLTDKKSSQLLERIIIEYINHYKYHNVLYNNNYKIDNNNECGV